MSVYYYFFVTASSGAAAAALALFLLRQCHCHWLSVYRYAGLHFLRSNGCPVNADTRAANDASVSWSVAFEESAKLATARPRQTLAYRLHRLSNARL